MQEDEDNFVFEDEEVHPENHDVLLNAVSQLYKKQKIEPPTRSEPSTKVSEFNLSTGQQTTDVVKVHDLIRVLDNKATHKDISKNVRLIQKKSKTLKKPLEKIYADRIARKLGYESVKKQLSKWDAIVHRNRSANQLVFPLKDACVDIIKEDEYKTPFKEPTELELEMQKIFNTSEVAKEEMAQEKEMMDLNLSLEEMVERRRMIAKMRARESYRIAKAIRQNKIKSKKYHRILKREKIKNELKEFELLQKTNPEAALEKLERIERARAEERMSLRHRNTGKWARSRAIRAKYDTEARAQLAEQLAKSRELTKKLKEDTDSENEDDTEPVDNMDSAEKNNPWVKKSESEINNFLNGYRKYWDEVEKKKHEKINDISVERIRSQNEADEECNIPDLIVSDDKNKLENEENGLQISPQNENEMFTKDESISESELLRDTEKLKDVEECCVVKINVEMKQPEEKLENTLSGKNYEKNKKNVENEKARNILNSSGSWSVLQTEKVVKKFENAPEKRNKAVRRPRGSWSIEELFLGVEDKVKNNALKKFKNIKDNMKQDDVKEVQKPIKQRDKSSDLSMMKKPKVSIDEKLLEVCEGGLSTGENDIKGLLDRISSNEKDTRQNLPEIDPDKFLPVKQKKLLTHAPELEEEGDDASSGDEDEKQKRLNLIEAFGDDDVVDQFRREKEDEIKSDKPKDVDLSLPGWGHWAGCSMPSVRKRKTSRRFVVKFPEVKRKDATRQHVIINENVDDRLKDHMVNELPYPFKSVKEYEASIRAPVGNTWMPEVAHKRLIAPPVLTKLGKIIEPMDPEQLVKNAKTKTKLSIKT